MTLLECDGVDGIECRFNGDREGYVEREVERRAGG